MKLILKLFTISLIIGLSMGRWLYGPFNSFAETPQAVGETRIYYFTEDHLGNIDTVTDEQGDIVERRDYLPYGATPSHIQEAEESAEMHSYNGKEQDENGLYYYGARYYDPTIGRFTTQDPWEGDLTDPQTLNKYSYVRNNPIKFIDPTGMFNEETGAIEKGDTSKKIKEGINKKWDTNYSWNQIVNLNSGILKGVKDLSKVTGKILIPNLDVPDITRDLTQKMHDYSKDKKLKNPLYFKEKFQDGGDWDLKSQPGIYCTQKSCGGQEYENYVFRAKEVRYDYPGNSLYGYVGMSKYVQAWLPALTFFTGQKNNLNTLLYYAGQNQMTKPGVPQQGSCNGDDCNDRDAIINGAMLQLGNY